MVVVLFSVLWVVMAAWIALTALPAGREGHMPMPYLIALVPFLWIPLVGLAVWAAVLHQWMIVVAMLFLALAASSRRMQYWGTGITVQSPVARSSTTQSSAARRGAPQPQQTTGRRSNAASERSTAQSSRSLENDINCGDHVLELGVPFTVMTLNCRYGRADAAHIVREVRERHIGVLALQELTGELVDRLDAAGLSDLLPYRQLGEERNTDNGGFNGVWTAYRPVSSLANAVDIPAADVPSITIALDGTNRTITFVSAHPKSPMRGCAQWSEGIRGLGALASAAQSATADSVVLMGDLNSGTDHPSFRALLQSGFTDASLAWAHGPNLSFPSWLPWPRIELDHILFTRGFKVAHVESFVVTDTDHLAVTATLSL